MLFPPAIAIATRNRHKIQEIIRICADWPVGWVSEGPDWPDVEETGLTYLDNALLKARAVAEASGVPSLADDSGIEIDALGGAPGVYTADWAGPKRDFSIAMQRVHDELEERQAWKGEPLRANFISVLCLAWPDGQTQLFEGKVYGHVVWPPRGGNGFGYDPIFIADGHEQTFGEMEPASKYAISHRTRAFDHFKRAVLDAAG
jgi:XTP/dITP diphosphohydrolase